MDIKEIIQKNMDKWNNKDKEGFVSDFAENSEIIGAGGPVLHGRTGAGLLWEGWHSALPDSRSSIINLFASGDQVCREGTFEGTHTGVLQLPDGSQIPPTGRYVSLRLAQISTVCDYQIVSSRTYFDQIELLTQLGVPEHLTPGSVRPTESV